MGKKSWRFEERRRHEVVGEGMDYGTAVDWAAQEYVLKVGPVSMVPVQLQDASLQ